MIPTIRGFGRILLPRLCSSSMIQPKNLLNNEVLQRSLYTIPSCSLDKGVNGFITKTTLLAPAELTQYNQVRGLKYVGKVHRRCKDCKMMFIDGVLHNHCTAHPRHNQKHKTKRPHNTWILSGVMCGQKRPW